MVHAPILQLCCGTAVDADDHPEEAVRGQCIQSRCHHTCTKGNQQCQRTPDIDCQAMEHICHEVAHQDAAQVAYEAGLRDEDGCDDQGAKWCQAHGELHHSKDAEIADAPCMGTRMCICSRLQRRSRRPRRRQSRSRASCPRRGLQRFLGAHIGCQTRTGCLACCVCICISMHASVQSHCWFRSSGLLTSSSYVKPFRWKQQMQHPAEQDWCSIRRRACCVTGQARKQAP